MSANINSVYEKPTAPLQLKINLRASVTKALRSVSLVIKVQTSAAPARAVWKAQAANQCKPLYMTEQPIWRVTLENSSATTKYVRAAFCKPVHTLRTESSCISCRSEPVGAGSVWNLHQGTKLLTEKFHFNACWLQFCKCLALQTLFFLFQNIRRPYFKCHKTSSGDPKVFSTSLSAFHLSVKLPPLYINIHWHIPHPFGAWKNTILQILYTFLTFLPLSGWIWNCMFGIVKCSVVLRIFFWRWRECEKNKQISFSFEIRGSSRKNQIIFWVTCWFALSKLCALLSLQRHTLSEACKSQDSNEFQKLWNQLTHLEMWSEEISNHNSTVT